ncbi:MAG: hypothetical protein AB1805_10165 [Nitrospirota bacterium]
MRWLFFAFCLLPISVSAEPGCVSTFEDFLSKFETDRSFQEENTVFPLKHSFVDLNADPEPRAVNKPLSKTEVTERINPIFPSPAAQRKVPFVRVIKSPTQTRSIVQLEKPDTGYLLIYHFHKIGKCWRLVEFEDAST